MPDNKAWWLGEYARQIQFAIDNNIEPNPDTQQQWTQLLENGGFATSATVIVQPLLTTTWGQGEPYNDQCPLYNGYRSVTGCVATAMAQIMKYWEHPTQRTVTLPAYTTSSLGISIPAITGTTTYDWKNMKNTTAEYIIDQQKNAVAKFMYECGVALQMDYTPDVSGVGSGNVYICSPSYLKEFTLLWW